MKKLEKDVDRHKFGSTQMLERNEQLVKDLETFRVQNSSLRDQVTKLETELSESHVRISLPSSTTPRYDRLSRQPIIAWKNTSNATRVM